MIKTAVVYIVTLVLTALAWLAGCGQDKILPGPDRAAVLGFSEAAMDTLFVGLTANDYATLSHDYDSAMQEKIPPTNFAAWNQELDSQLGHYLSRHVDQVTQSGEFYMVVYPAKFEREEQVTVTVAFHASDHSIASLSFDSEKYSWSAFE